jgi:hypothetical protein
MNLDRFVTKDQAAKANRVSTSLITKLTARAEISSVRIGRQRMYDPAKLRRELLERGRRDRKTRDAESA